MVGTTVLSAISYCRFYARRLSRHLLLPEPDPLGYCLSLEIFPSWAISQLLRLLPAILGVIIVSYWWDSQHLWVAFDCVAVQLCVVFCPPPWMSWVFGRQFPFLYCMVLGCPYFLLADMLSCYCSSWCYLQYLYTVRQWLFCLFYALLNFLVNCCLLLRRFCCFVSSLLQCSSFITWI